jgi:hypothetical protein
MNTPPQGNLTTIARLRAALEETAAALAAADLDRLLTGESELEATLTAMPALRGAFHQSVEVTLPPEERRLFRSELEGVSAALLRCRRLGATLSDFVRASLDARGEQLSYESDARAAAAALAGRGVSVKA